MNNWTGQRILKQGSMNDYLLSSERLKERERLKRSSMPRQITWSGEKYVCRKSPVAPVPAVVEPLPRRPDSVYEDRAPSPIPVDIAKDFSSFKNGFVRIWQSLRGDSKNLLLPTDYHASAQVNTLLPSHQT